MMDLSATHERMSAMITKVYDAFRSAGADEEKARRAAEAMHRQQQDELATRADLRELRQDIIIRLGGLMIALFGLAVAWFELRGG